MTGGETVGPHVVAEPLADFAFVEAPLFEGVLVGPVFAFGVLLAEVSHGAFGFFCELNIEIVVYVADRANGVGDDSFKGQVEKLGGWLARTGLHHAVDSLCQSSRVERPNPA